MDDLTEQLRQLVEGRLLDPVEILFEDALTDLRRTARRRASEWAATLTGPDDSAAKFLAIRLVAALYPGDDVFDPPAEWWATPLGRVMATRVGHPRAQSVSLAVAGAMLGISRQGVHDLVHRGKLHRHRDGGVDVASIRRRLSQKETL